MSEERTLEQVQKEHSQNAYSLGVLRYQIECLNTNMNETMDKMLKLNLEAAEIQKSMEKTNGTATEAATQKPAE